MVFDGIAVGGILSPDFPYEAEKSESSPARKLDLNGIAPA
jgi:hypothetical protein